MCFVLLQRKFETLWKYSMVFGRVFFMLNETKCSFIAQEPTLFYLFYECNNTNNWKSTKEEGDDKKYFPHCKKKLTNSLVTNNGKDGKYI